jgi:hypothetical protein
MVPDYMCVVWKVDPFTIRIASCYLEYLSTYPPINESSLDTPVSIQVLVRSLPAQELQLKVILP